MKIQRTAHLCVSAWDGMMTPLRCMTIPLFVAAATSWTPCGCTDLILPSTSACWLLICWVLPSVKDSAVVLRSPTATSNKQFCHNSCQDQEAEQHVTWQAHSSSISCLGSTSFQSCSNCWFYTGRRVKRICCIPPHWKTCCEKAGA